MGKFSPQSMKKLVGIKPKLVDVCLKAVELSPVDFCIVQGVRTRQYQEALYAQGRDNLEDVNRLRKNVNLALLTAKENKDTVTNTLNSDHIPDSSGLGSAIDFALGPANSPKWVPLSDFQKVVNCFKVAARDLGVKLDCGIDWKRPDYGHIAIKENK